jgi:hypothetical protein
MDWSKRSSTSHNRKTEKNQMPIENGKMGSRKKGECGDKIPMCMDEFGEIESEMGIALR